LVPPGSSDVVFSPPFRLRLFVGWPRLAGTIAPGCFRPPLLHFSAPRLVDRAFPCLVFSPLHWTTRTPDLQVSLCFLRPKTLYLSARVFISCFLYATVASLPIPWPAFEETFHVPEPLFFLVARWCFTVIFGDCFFLKCSSLNVQSLFNPLPHFPSLFYNVPFFRQNPIFLKSNPGSFRLRYFPMFGFPEPGNRSLSFLPEDC